MQCDICGRNVGYESGECASPGSSECTELGLKHKDLQIQALKETLYKATQSLIQNLYEKPLTPTQIVHLVAEVDTALDGWGPEIA